MSFKYDSLSAAAEAHLQWLFLQAYYQVNRRMQLNNDLSAQNTFLQHYKGYLAQLVGYFVIEERVRRISHALSGGEVWN